jgi:hypothetical protein
MTDMHDELSPSPDPEELRIKDFDVRGAVFVIPLDAPIPSELTGIELPTGSLYQRLAALDAEQLAEFAFVPLAGSEMLALDRVWRTLQRAKRVYALFDLPGARYDVLFTQAARQIGLQRVDWPAVAEALASRTRTVQRVRDTEPYKLPVAPSRTSKLPRATTAGDMSPLLPPTDTEDDENTR